MRWRLAVEFGSVERRSRGGWFASDGIVVDVVSVLVVVVSRASIARAWWVRESERERMREEGGKGREKGKG